MATNNEEAETESAVDMQEIAQNTKEQWRLNWPR